MARIFLLYGTTEGHTRKVVDFVAERLRQKGLEVDVHDALHFVDAFDPKAYGGALIAASLHIGKYQAPVRRFAKQCATALTQLPNAFLSVSLAAAGHEEEDAAGLKECVENFQEETQWRPQEVQHIAGAFRYTEYDFFKKWIMKRIARDKGAPVDTSRDWELTDWEALGRAIDAFAARLPAIAVSGRVETGSAARKSQ